MAGATLASALLSPLCRSQCFLGQGRECYSRESLNIIFLHCCLELFPCKQRWRLLEHYTSECKFVPRQRDHRGLVPLFCRTEEEWDPLRDVNGCWLLLEVATDGTKMHWAINAHQIQTQVCGIWWLQEPMYGLSQTFSFSCVVYDFHCLDVKDKKLKRRLQEREGKQLHVASLPLEPKPTSSAAQLSSGLGHLSLGLHKHSHLGKWHYYIFFNII